MFRILEYLEKLFSVLCVLLLPLMRIFRVSTMDGFILTVLCPLFFSSVLGITAYIHRESRGIVSGMLLFLYWIYAMVMVRIFLVFDAVSLGY